MLCDAQRLIKFTPLTKKEEEKGMEELNQKKGVKAEDMKDEIQS
jgi:hypothetical protein